TGSRSCRCRPMPRSASAHRARMRRDRTGRVRSYRFSVQVAAHLAENFVGQRVEFIVKRIRMSAQRELIRRIVAFAGMMTVAPGRGCGRAAVVLDPLPCRARKKMQR